MAGFLNPEQKLEIINLIADAAGDEDIMLEAATLQGAKSEKDRVFSAETVKEILQGIANLDLDTQKTKARVRKQIWLGKLPHQKYPLSWLIERSWPIKGWTDEDLKKIKEKK